MKSAYQMGYDAKTICDNPFWKEFPKRSPLGESDELNARQFVDGYVEKLNAGLNKMVNQ